MSKNRLIRLGFTGLAAYGFLAGLNLSQKHMATGEACPMLGPIPACYLVAVAYFLILAASVMPWHRHAAKLFYLGWVPVMGLALSGVVLEFTRGSTCPPGAYAIPQCFYSLGVALLCWFLFNKVRRRN